MLGKWVIWVCRIDVALFTEKIAQAWSFQQRSQCQHCCSTVQAAATSTVLINAKHRNSFESIRQNAIGNRGQVNTRRDI